MKSCLVAVVLLVILTPLSAQETKQEKTRVKEVGFTFYNLNRFGLTYRLGNTNAVWRFNSILLNGTEQNSSSQIVNQSFGVVVNTGREWRK